MSYTLAFWSGGDSDECTELFNRLRDGEHVAEVSRVDADGLLVAIDGLAGWTRRDAMLYPPGGADDGPVFDTFIDDQLVVFTGFGVEPEHINVVIDLMREQGCRLYDPQVVERFD
ncbi:hypothetical protein [Gordonia hydrophobica]|uniref:Uncharacterized protein n=1 Tax=Gordonia hydrophobica TaxID=40516 RepID=A0ABZ2TXK5_9ACTN|nr:hypothetical protein [Gordonia hydrophobica]MBM7366315.1 hypothetical protein [Gordonia hydrophobica]